MLVTSLQVTLSLTYTQRGDMGWTIPDAGLFKVVGGMPMVHFLMEVQRKALPP